MKKLPNSATVSEAIKFGDDLMEMILHADVSNHELAMIEEQVDTFITNIEDNDEVSEGDINFLNSVMEKTIEIINQK